MSSIYKYNWLYYDYARLSRLRYVHLYPQMVDMRLAMAEYEVDYYRWLHSATHSVALGALMLQQVTLQHLDQVKQSRLDHEKGIFN